MAQLLVVICTSSSEVHVHYVFSLAGDGDYAPVTQTITFPAGTTTQPVPVVTLDDDISELTENFGVRLSNPNGAGLPFSLGSQDTASADIRDNDREFQYEAM